MQNFKSEEPSISDLESLMAKGGVQLKAMQRDRLWQFHKLLREADAKLNLTRIRAFDPMVEKHYIDSMLAGVYVDLKGPVMDLGSGGGFPGIPLAIRHPKTQFILVEGRRTRAGFLMNVKQQLGLDNVEVIARKLNPKDQIQATTVITRAFSSVLDILERTNKSISPGGYAVMLKGPNCDDELQEAMAQFPDWDLQEDIRYVLPFSQAERRILVLKKNASDNQLTTYPAITSTDNPRIKQLKKLHQAKNIRKSSSTLLSGEKYIAEMLVQFPESIKAIFAKNQEQLQRLKPDHQKNLDLIEVNAAVMNELDQLSGDGPVAEVVVCEPSEWSRDLKTALTLFIPSQLPDNVGALLRSADAFGIRDIVLLQGAAHPYLQKSTRASGPAAWRLNLMRGPSLQALGDLNLNLATLDIQGMSITDYCKTHDITVPLGLILGVEGQGTNALPAKIPRLTIPTTPHNDSLNSAVAAGIALYEFTKINNP